MWNVGARRVATFSVVVGLLLSLGVYVGSQPVQAVASPALVSVVPARVLETRVGPGFSTVDGQFEGIGVRSAGSTTELVVAGRAGVPVDADAVWINLTGVGLASSGFVTVYPCGESRPLASSLNVRPGKVSPNAVLAEIGEGGRICVYTAAAIDMVADVNGYVPQGGTPNTVSPARLLETRSGQGYRTIDGEFEGGGIRPAGSTLRLTVAGRGGVDGDADAVLINLTVVEPVARGYITVYPCGTPRPLASSVNYGAGDVVPGAVLARVGDDGKICIYNSAATNLVVDVNGFVPGGEMPFTVIPARLLETRSGPDRATIDAQFEGVGTRSANSVTELVVVGRGGVPSSADAVLINLTAIESPDRGFLTVYPCGQERPLASNVNYRPGVVVPNAVLAKVGVDGKVCIYTSAEVDMVIDVSGFTLGAASQVLPLGVEVATIDGSKGITIGSVTYAPSGARPWLQILTIDRRSLEMVRNVTVQFEPPGGPFQVGLVQIGEATDEIERGTEAELVIVSGGGREVTVDVTEAVGPALRLLFRISGVVVNQNEEFDSVTPDLMARGTWSSIGIPGVLESGQINLGGLEYGLLAGDSGSAGSLAGYLRRGGLGNFSFVSAAYEALDTRAAGSTDTVNVVRVGATDYTSETLVPGTSGFQVVVLDSRLRLLDNQTFVINGLGSNPDFQPQTAAMQEYLGDLQLGRLVIVQSINSPFGWQPEWAWDAPLVNNEFTDNYNRVVQRGPALWYSPATVGETLAGVIGLLGGAKAHDQFAALNDVGGERTNGFTMVASVGQMDTQNATGDNGIAPVLPGSEPLVQVGSNLSNPSEQIVRTDRVVGVLQRDRRALWMVSSNATFDRPSTPGIEEITYQALTDWPLSSGADNQRANCFFASELFAGLGYTDVRTAYYSSDLTPDLWLSKVNSLRNLEWHDALQCSGRTFSESAFDAVQTQLADEMNMVATVAGVFADWVGLFEDASFANYIDLQTIANAIISDIESIDASDQSTVKTDEIVSSSLDIAGAISSVVVPELGAALWVMSGVFGLAAATNNDSTGQPSLAPLESEVSSLAESLVTQLSGATANFSQIQNILVSDWGKLQQSSNLAAEWAPRAPEVREILAISAKRQFYSALLPTVYMLYYVDPEYISDFDVFNPWELSCDGSNQVPGGPFPISDQDNGATMSPVIGTFSDGIFINNLLLGTRISISRGGVLNGYSSQPDLTSIAGDNLFESLASDDPSALGMNQTAFFADPRFTTRWFWCVYDA